MNDVHQQDPTGDQPAKAQTPAPVVDVSQPLPNVEPRLRLWPGVIIVALLWGLILGAGWFAPGTMIQFLAMFWGPMIGAVAFTIWWLFGSRLRWTDRGVILLASGIIGAASFYFWHRSFGLFGLILYVVPAVMTAWIFWLIVTPFIRWPVRRLGLLIVFVLVWGYFTLIRFEGVDGSMSANLRFRWTPTAEEKFLAGIAPAKTGPAIDSSATTPLSLEPGDWPGFRGANRDGRLTGFQITTDWEQRPPQLVWRHRVGPGWSSFAVVGTHLYTQEQRGEDEVVVCYDAASGAELWVHRDSARFNEVIGGPGPRATPTFSDGKIYALGAAGRLNCLDAATGQTLWARDIVADSGAVVPQWGFAASPLVVQGLATVFAGGPQEKSVLSYKAASGELVWTAGAGQASYCSLQPARLDGVEQLVIATDKGLTAFQPADGKVLWQHNWPLEGGMARIVQPTMVDDSSILIGTGFGIGTRRLRVSRAGNDWSVQEVWTTRAIKPYYNDMVAHHGYLYGFDGNLLVCVSLEDGKGKWRERGYGNGQLLLLADQDLLLVLSETGEVALVEATPEHLKELCRFQAIEGKTWNHPVVANGKLFVRNGEEAACYQLVGKHADDAVEYRFPGMTAHRRLPFMLSHQ